MKFAKAARPLVMGRNGVVSSGHHLASLAGLKVLQEGGNAVDAALAAAFVMTVVRPETCGPGGDLFALVAMRRSGKVEALNASGPAPARASIEHFRERGLRAIPVAGPLSVAVPGAVDGWLELHRRYGTKDLARLTADAVALAAGGFPVHQELVERIAEFSRDFPWIERVYRQPLGELRPGKILHQKGLGEVLALIGREGRAGFYGGRVAETICKTVQAEGGLLCEEDLQRPVAQWLEPLSTRYRDWVVYEQPPVSQGFMVLEMLNLIEPWPLHLGTMDRAEVIHLQVQAKKLAFEDRIRYLEDPAFGEPKVGMLISKEYAAERRGAMMQAPTPRASAVASASDTTFLCAVDRDGNAISLIQSIFAPFGSRVIGGDTGVILNNRLCSFGLDAGRANALCPGKRPAHTLNTYMVYRDGEFFLAGGSPGADDQPQTNLQILHNILDREMDPQTAVEAPRWSHQPGTPPRHELPEELKLEQGFAPDVIEGLKQRGYPVSVVDRWSFGSAKIVLRDPATGTWMAGADPRREAYALAW
ncbi:MAG TPA: gamma-glutamyltransferase [candidate division Zixibacteria bacterium]|nr:gamma-glutamyltransferase [candidate division Zixibacteria bacterium]